MKRKRWILYLVLTLMVTGCSTKQETKETETKKQQDIKQELIDAASKLEPSKELYFENKLEITGIGEMWDDHPTGFNDCYYWPAIEKLTNAHVSIDWHTEDDYPSTIASVLLMGKENYPDILFPDAFGVMDLADDGVIVPLDDYLDLMPNVVKALGNRLNEVRQIDGHIYSIPTITEVPGSQTMMVRKDWLEKLGLSEPKSWDEWVNLWRQIRDNDLNGNGDTTDEIPLALEQGKTGERCMAALLNAFGIKCNYECTVCVLDDGTYTLVTEHPKYKDFLKAVNQLYKEGLIDNNYSTRYQQELFDAMDKDLVGTTFTWAERCSISTQTLRDNGNKDALWEAVAPIKGPYGDQILPARHMVNSIWCITATAKEKGKLEDILRLFDWCFSKEGYYLYNYGIEGVSYDMVEGKPILKEEMVKNGFTDYRNYGCQFEPFGGYFQEDTFMQCLFKGKNIDELDEPSVQFYKGLTQVNDGFYYNQIKPLETDSYVKNHTSLITDKLCKLRDQAITGEISLKDFWKKYENLKGKGLQEIIEEGNKAYKKISAS